MTENLVFDLPVNAVLLQSQYPIDQIWQLHQNGFDNKAAMNMDQTQIQLIIWRRQSKVCIERLTTDEWELLKLFNEATPLSEVCEKMVGKAIDINVILPALIRKGWIRNVHIP